jgi:UDP-N-acetylmuramoyl-tripeptide--D-alanyl-D-alanine ligase|uniref:UDP-N-acetylmuramoyl-tripeptide--D-alanyl-D-alanine ligase n=1 Tax=Desulfobacca acetoxidans TaxID=60893 RepID=A0A7V6A3N8_9BACT
MPATFTAADLIAATRGTLHQGRAKDGFVGVSTDSRTCQTGELFVPLVGERHDGHDYIPKALGRGARGVLVERRILRSNGLRPPLPQDMTAVAVADTLTALGDLARDWRQRFLLPVVSLTGSCGKTTAKEMIALILSRFFRVLKNELNLNNLIGLPHTLLRLDGTHEAVVVEMGMNRFGEIRRLTEISQPTVGVLLNVYPAHTEGVGCVEGVARAKGELIQALSRDATLVYNADDPRVACQAGNFPGRRLGFGFGPDADLRILDRQFRGPAGQVLQASWRGTSWPITLRVPGGHQALNAMAATAVAAALGLPLREASAALADFTAIQRRSQMEDLPSGVHLLNDCYNANPGSMATALATLAELKGTGRAAAALGDMLELGAAAVEAHRELGRQAAGAGLDLLVIYGNHRGDVAEGAREAGLSGLQIFPVTDKMEGAQLLREFLRPGDWLLVKGSRSMHMEQIVDLLKEEK